MGLNKKNLLSKLCILLFALYWIFSFFQYERVKKNPILWDVVSFYGYLPAVFIYKDITLRFTEKDPNFFVMKYWPETAPNGGKVIKTTMGVSYLYAPFFFLGHWYAGSTGEPQDGFSLSYQVFLQIGTLFYMLFGFIFLRKLLLNYFSDQVTSLTIFSIFFGTNLLFYATGGALMSHAYLFSVSCLYLLAIDSWHRQPTIKTSILIGLTGGLLALMKPTMIVYVLIPLLWGITNIESVKKKIKFIVKNKWKLCILIFFFLLPGVPQLLYWKYITGNWFFFSYTGERFFFDKPYIYLGWFSYRNGWLLYTPIMTFALAGFFFMRKKMKHLIFPFLMCFAISVYLIHSWWCWWHGGYGLRAYVELYGVLALPLAAFYDFLLSKKRIARISILTAATLLIAHNIFQEWQFEKGLLHFAAMTKKSYWLGFLKTEVPGPWWQCLKEADIGKAMLRLPEYNEKDVPPPVLETIKTLDFEAIDNDTNYSSAVAYRGKYSYKLIKHKSSPSMSFPAAFLLSDTSKGERMVSVKFYCTEDIQYGNAVLSILFKDDSTVYVYKDRDFYVVDSEPNKWNEVLLELPIKELRNNTDNIDIGVWSPRYQREIFIDDLQYGIVRPKDIAK